MIYKSLTKKIIPAALNMRDTMERRAQKWAGCARWRRYEVVGYDKREA
jgi:hypothetical protein